MSQAFNDRVEAFCRRLTDRRIDGTLAAAKGTAELLRQLVTSSRLNTPEIMLAEVKRVGLRIQAAKPIELVIGNIVRRVMHIIREEMEAEREEQDDDLVGGPAGDAAAAGASSVGGLSRAFRHPFAATSTRTLSLHNLLDQGALDEAAEAAMQQQAAAATTAAAPAQQVIDGVNDLIQELKDIDDAIASQAVEHIHANEVVLVFGYSRTVLHFLRRAAEKRNFEVVVAEAAPTYQGQQMASELAAAGIHATLIPDSAIFAMMARVNKVIATAHALLANGSVMAPVGMHVVAMAARRHSVPCVVLCGIYKLSTLFPHNPSVNFNDFRDPADLLPYNHEAVGLPRRARAEALLKLGEEGDEWRAGLPSGLPELTVANPSYDYVPPELISLFVTDQGHGFMPSYVYRQLTEFYHRQDFILDATQLNQLIG
ncbi:hypothetical protein ABPG77_002662 [Micractinium sp. CCAP 211/92]